MQATSFQFQVRQISRQATVIDIVGEVTAASEEALGNAFADATAAGPKAIILSFAGLEYMNSSGIGLLVTLLIRAQRQKQKLLACGLNEHYRQIFQLTRLDEAIGIFSDESQAAAAAK